MNTTKLFLFVVIGAVTLVAAGTGTQAAFAQITPPPLEDAANNTDSSKEATVSLGKVTIQISQTEQIVLDLPLKSDNKYQIIPIK